MTHEYNLSEYIPRKRLQTGNSQTIAIGVMALIVLVLVLWWLLVLRTDDRSATIWREENDPRNEIPPSATTNTTLNENERAAIARETARAQAIAEIEALQSRFAAGEGTTSDAAALEALKVDLAPSFRTATGSAISVWNEIETAFDESVAAVRENTATVDERLAELIDQLRSGE